MAQDCIIEGVVEIRISEVLIVNNQIVRLHARDIVEVNYCPRTIRVIPRLVVVEEAIRPYRATSCCNIVGSCDIPGGKVRKCIGVRQRDTGLIRNILVDYELRCEKFPLYLVFRNHSREVRMGYRMARNFMVLGCNALPGRPGTNLVRDDEEGAFQSTCVKLGDTHIRLRGISIVEGK